jgi:hypothetical protein
LFGILLLYGGFLALLGRAFDALVPVVFLWLATSLPLAARTWKPDLLLAPQGVTLQRFGGAERHGWGDVRVEVVEPASHCGDVLVQVSVAKSAGAKGRLLRVPSDYQMSPEELVDLLNRWRARYGGAVGQGQADRCGPARP